MESTVPESTTLMSTCVDVWNAKIEAIKGNHPSYSQVRTLTKQRREKLRSRLKDPEWLETFRVAVGMLPIKQWNDWVPDFDHMIANDSNAVKIAEGQRHKKDFTLSDKNRQTIEDYRPSGLVLEMMEDERANGGHQAVPAIDENPVRRIRQGS